MLKIKIIWLLSIFDGVAIFFWLIYLIDFAQTENPILLILLSYLSGGILCCTVFYLSSSILFPDLKNFIIDTEIIEKEPGHELNAIKTKYRLSNDEIYNSYIKRFMWARDVSLFFWSTVLALAVAAIIFGIIEIFFRFLF